ncbi:hypothetical protein FACS1894206_08800 [Deltaproteobacteria bacterium]|nr:hypothetical protein FACS1894206_08800 [Deltaproteobacteria bacterium]
MPIQELIILGLLTALCVVGFIDHSDDSFVLIPDYLAASGFPRVCAGLLLASVAAHFVSLLRQKAAGIRVAYEPIQKIMLTMIAVVFFYLIGFIYVGFYVSTVIFNIVCLYVLLRDHRDAASDPTDKGALSLKVIGIYTVCVMGAWYALFASFRLYLPTTLLF